MVQHPASEPADPLVGKVLSQRYRILAKLGEGAMAAVYLAEHTGVGTNIVLKVLLPDLAGKQDLVDRFLQEAKIASEIHHDNVIDIFYHGRSPEGQVFLAMEYLQGTTLFELLERDGPMRWGRAQPILVQIAEALAAAHGKGVVHRDVKPENVLIVDRDKPDGGSSEFVKVVDFGIANVGGGVAGSMGVCGTPEYMAPEQARAQPPDPRDDIYAFGCLMYQVLTGDVPFTAPSIQKVLLMHMQQPVEPPRARRPDLEILAGAEAIVMKCLEKTRDRRFQNMVEVSKAIGAVAIPRKLTPPPGTHPYGGGALYGPSPVGDRRVFEVPEPKQRKRRRLALASLVVAIFSLAAWLGHKRHPAGHLEVVADPPDAEIFVDGRRIGNHSPITIDASQGRYTVLVRREGCDDVSKVVDVLWGGSVSVPLTLPVSEATRVELESDPPGARLWLDGEPLLDGGQQARTPFSAGRIAAGWHTVEMDGSPEMGTWRGDVLVSLGSSRTLRGVLPRAPTPPRAAASHETAHPSRPSRSRPEAPPPRTSHSSHSSHATRGTSNEEARQQQPGVHAPGTTYIDLKSGDVRNR